MYPQLSRDRQHVAPLGRVDRRVLVRVHEQQDQLVQEGRGQELFAVRKYERGRGVPGGLHLPGRYAQIDR